MISSFQKKYIYIYIYIYPKKLTLKKTQKLLNLGLPDTKNKKRSKPNAAFSNGGTETSNHIS